MRQDLSQVWLSTTSWLAYCANLLVMNHDRYVVHGFRVKFFPKKESVKKKGGVNG